MVFYLPPTTQYVKDALLVLEVVSKWAGLDATTQAVQLYGKE